MFPSSWQFPPLVALLLFSIIFLLGGVALFAPRAHAGSEPMEPLPVAAPARHPPVAPGGGCVPAGARIVLHEDKAAISDVTRRTDDRSADRSLRYAVVPLQATPLAAMSALWEAEAEIILVSRDPDAGRAADVVGVVTQTALARLLKTDEELSSSTLTGNDPASAKNSDPSACA